MERPRRGRTSAHVDRCRGGSRDRGVWSLPVPGRASPERVDACDLRRRGGRARVPSEPRVRSSALRLPSRPSGKRAAPPARVVAVVLPPPTRAVTPIPTLAIPAGVDRVRFELQLETNDFPSYRVGLKDPATRSDSVAQRLDRSALVRGPGVVPVVVPANLLGPQHYSLDLAGRDAGGRAEVIGSYTVQVVQP